MADRAPTSDRYAAERERMVMGQIESRGIRDGDTLRAMRTVPRERFVPAELRDRAYADGALSIGDGQSISQPYIVARTTEALGIAEWRRAHPDESPRLLDVGTGSGYQAAVLAELGATVTAVEINAGLAAQADARLADLGYSVQVIVGDGGEGAPAHGPFAGIAVAAAAPEVPPRLFEQLADGGTLVLPIGDRGSQVLTAVRRQGIRSVRRELEAVAFVPLLGRYGFR
jgi:protein-L-isoaspartate(D-aspartate) O-methyltransferase